METVYCLCCKRLVTHNVTASTAMVMRTGFVVINGVTYRVSICKGGEGHGN